MIRVLICDDHEVVRRGLKDIINGQSDMKVLGEASNAWELLDFCRKKSWDVVVLDISMPKKSGLEVLLELKKEKPKLPVIMMSVHSEDLYAIRAIKSGASGYLTKDSLPEELVKAIRKVVGGGKFIGPQLAERLALELDISSEKAPHEELSNREFQVMCLIAAGKSLNDISHELSLSPKTISTFRSRILDKMNLRNNAELVHYVFENHLLS